MRQRASSVCPRCGDSGCRRTRLAGCSQQAGPRLHPNPACAKPLLTPPCKAAPACSPAPLNPHLAKPPFPPPPPPQVEEGYEEGDPGSPRASSYTPGASAADLAGLGDSAEAAGSRALPNGGAPQAPRGGSPRGGSPQGGSPRAAHAQRRSSAAEHGRHSRAVKLPRHRVRAALRRAPHYAAEGARQG